MHHAGIIRVHAMVEMPDRWYMVLEYQLKVPDFRFSVIANSRAALLRSQCGTAAYAVPELFGMDMHTDARADIWSMGVVPFVTPVIECSEHIDSLQQNMCSFSTVSFIARRLTTDAHARRTGCLATLQEFASNMPNQFA
jgi:serine/threonine protein kinase